MPSQNFFVVTFLILASCSSEKDENDTPSRETFTVSESARVRWHPEPIVEINDTSTEDKSKQAPLSSFVLFAESKSAYMVKSSDCVKDGTCDPTVTKDEYIPKEWVTTKLEGMIPGKDLIEGLRGKSGDAKFGMKLSTLPLVYVGFRGLNDDLRGKGDGVIILDFITTLGIHSEVVNFAKFMKGDLPDFGGCLKISSEKNSTKLEDKKIELGCELDFTDLPSALILDYEY